MKRGPYATASHAFEGAAVDLDYVRRGYKGWRAELPPTARQNDVINSFALQFGVVLEQDGKKWFWSVPGEEEVHAALAGQPAPLTYAQLLEADLIIKELEAASPPNVLLKHMQIAGSAFGFIRSLLAVNQSHLGERKNGNQSNVQAAGDAQDRALSRGRGQEPGELEEEGQAARE
jgi:hypothetical protein